MQKLFKKIITLTSLIIFLFGLFIPFGQIFAQDVNNQLRIVVDKMKAPEDTSIITLTSGEDVFITAKTYQLTNKLISFEASPAGGAIFSPQQCTTDGNSFSDINSCQIGFKAISEGTFKIKASTNFNGKLYSNEIDIIVTATGVELKNCPTGQILVNNICTTLKSATTPTTDTTYTPLAPLPGLENASCKDINGNTVACIETDKNKVDCPFGNYLNIIIKIVIGFAAVLAMVMIVIGGIEYMTSDLVSSKEAGKERITHAVLGLLLALGSYLILNTINPQLLSVCLDKLPQAEIVINQDEANFAKTEQSVISAGKGYTLNGTASSGVSDFVTNHLAKGEPLYAIKVDITANRAYFYVGTDWKTMVFVPISKGRNGVSEIGQAQSGDFKTPKGTTYITSDRRPQGIPPIVGQAALTRDGKYNMGPAFINIGATLNGEDRGIGFHGNASNTPTTTQGCIRMKNDDLFALAKYMIQGVKVIIE